MQLFKFVALVLSVFQAAAWAADTPPKCGLLCISESALKSTCALTNVTCICTNAPLNEEISACVKSSCSVREQLATQKYSNDTCGVPSRDRSTLVWVIPAVFGILGFIAFVLRVLARLLSGAKSWGSDDWVMTAAVCLMIPFAVFGVPLARNGLGKDIWNVPPDNITQLLWFYYWDELIYIAVIPLTKISILLFYLKIFPRRELRVAVWVLIGVNALYLVVFEIISIFQCTPIDGAWRAWDGEYPTTCRNVNLQAWMAAVFTIILDVATLIVPLPELFKLSMSLKKKVQILIMFSLGFFVTIVSIVRLTTLSGFLSHSASNLTQDFTEGGIWSTIEVPVGIICACLPAIRLLFTIVFPGVLDGSRNAKSSYANISNQSKPTSNSQKLSSAPAVRVKTEWTIQSKHQDDSSQVELTAIAMGDDDRHVSGKKPTTPHESI